MTKNNSIKLFSDKKIRVQWNEIEEEWYFSIVDVIAILTENDYQGARNYWKVLKSRLLDEGNQSVTNCNQLKMQSPDGKFYKTDVANTKQLLRLIQSVPSKKAEPFKLWLAQVGDDRIKEIEDPEISITRALNNYSKKGYSKEWINQRLKSIDIRKELTDEWNRAGIDKPNEYAILTNEITMAWSGKSVREYKNFKSLKRENLRDNMTNMELVLNMLAEITTKEFSEVENPKDFEESKTIAKKGGSVAGNTRRDIENQTGRKIVTKENSKKIHFSKNNQLS
ncbi:MAG: Bro-N domain-containing protein [Nanoarchaeota archaeon]